jgi:hypothetical protein
VRPFVLAAGLLTVLTPTAVAEPTLRVGFGEADITPPLAAGKPVYLAGFGQNRAATGVHDPLLARAVVLDDGRTRIALVAVDLVGFFLPNVERVRQRLGGFAHVLVSSTHNHEGPDTLGLWGPGPFKSGIDPDYMNLVEARVAEAVRAAVAALRPAVAVIGTAQAPELLHDTRPPQIKHDELVAIEFRDPAGGKPLGVVVQWNCHPETLGDKNTLVSADYVSSTVDEVRKAKGCPVVYLTGTVGGLMTSLKVEVRTADGRELKDGTFEKTDEYGRRVGRLALKALDGARPVTLTPLAVHRRDLYLPVANRLYLAAWQLGVLQRQAFGWTGDPTRGEPLDKPDLKRPLAIKTELAWLRLGELDVAGIPGEIYPELVLGQVPDPAPAGADFPDAPVEPAVYPQLPGKHRLLIGLGCDEIGYIIPKRQWDEKPPFTYDQRRAPYGEINSLGPETAPLLCAAFRDLVRGK